jgi:hypothetical protein
VQQPALLRLPQKARAATRVARRLCAGLRTRGRDNAFDALRAAFYRRFWSDAAAAVGAELHELGAGYLQARRGSAWTLICGEQIALDSHLRARLARHKMLTARLLAPLGFTQPEAISFELASLDKGLSFLAAAKGPVVLKPDGVPNGQFGEGPGAGRGITCGVRQPDEFVRAARHAALFGNELIAEREVEGASYRLLYVDGRLVDAVRRDPPRVFGDGLCTIAELMRAETAERLAARPPMALHPLDIDLDCRLTLARQGLAPEHVPGALEAVVVKTVCNQNAAHDNHVARDRIHPELERLGARLVGHLGLRLAGVDIMSPDPSLAPSAERFAFNEINANPGLHHHWLVAEPERRAPVGALALEAALS